MREEGGITGLIDVRVGRREKGGRDNRSDRRRQPCNNIISTISSFHCIP